MFVVGLTGGIGSGKSAASDHFEALGIKVVDADIASRTVVEPGKPALAQIAEHFGNEVLLADGSLNRAYLRQKIFSDPAAKQWLESLLHPLIRQEIAQGLESATTPYAVFVSPLLVESGQESFCDRLLVIDVPEELQISRTIQRDSNDRTQVERIIASQATRQQRLEKASEIIENTGDLKQLQQEVNRLHRFYLAEAEQKASKGSEKGL